MSLLATLDRVVYATRIDRIIFMTTRPRIFRWTPIVLLTALAVGYVAMAKSYAVMAAEHRVTPPYLWGWALFYGAYLGAAFLRLFGPRFTGTAHRELDERELALKSRAHAISGIILVGLAMMGCFYMAWSDLLKLWQPVNAGDWINLAFGLQASAMLLPTWIASWMQPRLGEDEDA